MSATPTLPDLITEISDGETAGQLRFLADQAWATNPDDRARYSTLSLREAFDPAGFEERVMETKYGYVPWLQWAEVGRNLLVLVPIMLTWYGLWQAALSYNQLISTRGELVTQPFLLSWERGFSELGSRPGWHPTFSEIALLDCVILFIVLILTIFIDRRRHIKRDQAIQNAAEQRKVLERVLWRLDLRFAQIRQEQNAASSFATLSMAVSSFPQRASDLVDALRREQTRLAGLTRQQADEVRQLHDFIANLSDFTTKFRESAGTMQSSSEKIEGAVNKLSTQVENHGMAQGTLITALEGVMGEATLLKDWAMDMAGKFESSAVELRGVADAAISNADRVSGMIRPSLVALDSATSALAGGSRTLSASLDATKAAMERISTGLEDAVSGASESATLNAGVATELVSVAGELQNVAGSNRDVKTALEGVAERQRLSTDAIRTSTDAILAIPEQIARNKADLIDQVAHLDGAISHFSSVYENSVQRVQDATTALGSVTAGMTSISQHQLRVLTRLEETASSLSSVPGELTASVHELSGKIEALVRELERVPYAVTSAGEARGGAYGSPWSPDGNGSQPRQWVDPTAQWSAQTTAQAQPPVEAGTPTSRRRWWDFLRPGRR